MPMRDDRGDVDREILDIIPERFDADPDSRYARKSAHTRLILTIALVFLAVAALGVAARHILFGEAPKNGQAGVPVIHADDKPIKTRPQDRGGMDVPNQDKLVYERMGAGDTAPQAERLLPPPEQPEAPPAEQPRMPSIKPAFPAPPVKEASAATRPAAPETSPETSPVGTPRPEAAVTAPSQPPAHHAKPTAAHAPAAAEPAARPRPVAGGHWLVQLGALRSEAEAKKEWNRLRGVDRDVLGELPSNIVRVDLGAKGVFWRLRAGPMEEARARTLCAALAKRSQGCIVAKK